MMRRSLISKVNPMMLISMLKLKPNQLVNSRTKFKMLSEKLSRKIMLETPSTLLLTISSRLPLKPSMRLLERQPKKRQPKRSPPRKSPKRPLRQLTRNSRLNSRKLASKLRLKLRRLSRTLRRRSLPREKLRPELA